MKWRSGQTPPSVGTSPTGTELDHSRGGPSSRFLTWINQPHQWLIQGDPVQIISQDPLAQRLLELAPSIGESCTEHQGFLSGQEGLVFWKGHCQVAGCDGVKTLLLPRQQTALLVIQLHISSE